MNKNESVTICYDLGTPLETRMKHILLLTEEELNELVECLCSSYNIHPTFICLHYLYRLIMYDGIELQRRIRIGEICDLYSVVLFLLHKQPWDRRIGLVETFSNQYLKIHSYQMLFKLTTNVDIQIQIMKNLFVLVSKEEHGTLSPFSNKLKEQNKKYFFDWFKYMLRNDSVEYKQRSNCADFLLTQSDDSNDKREAVVFLGLEKINPTNLSILTKHKENVHFFTPKQKQLELLMNKKYNKEQTIEDILSFIQKHDYDTNTFRFRILEDKTKIGSFSSKYSLEEIMSAVWNELTEDLKHLLLRDIESSTDDDGWSCTTGYFNRILSIYQTTLGDESVFDLFENSSLVETEIFTELSKLINKNLGSEVDEKLEKILDELPLTSEDKRINYLTFKVGKLPEIINQLKVKYESFLSTEQFDEFFSKALRRYEDGL